MSNHAAPSSAPPVGLTGRVTPALARLAVLGPALVAAAGLTAAAFGLHAVSLFGAVSPLILAIAIGMLANFVAGGRITTFAGPGLSDIARFALRFGVVLLGFQITPQKLAGLGWIGFAIAAATLVATFTFTSLVGRWMGIRRELGDLVAAGTSICGASAIAAMTSVSRSRREDVAYAIACVTVFGSVSMILFPLLGDLFGLTARAYGIWTGAAIHEVAQVVAAGFQRGTEAGTIATIAKLDRVVLLAPMVLLVGRLRRAEAGEAAAKVPFPLFVLGFAALAFAGSVIDIPPVVVSIAGVVATVLLTGALGALGLAIRPADLAREGWRPLALAALSWTFVTVFSYLMVAVFVAGGA
ncbi:YeiH family protein [Methyloraptor flagellatus]|uniref:Sulfate exporter family transporter n=1 Tax=Methyloraptor flagellatus TaxID=3162530 RepID=A0AAU7XDL4_9HYPH